MEGINKYRPRYHSAAALPLALALPTSTGTCLSPGFQLLWADSWKWTCRLRWEFYASFWRNGHTVFQRHHFLFTPVVYEGESPSMSSPILVIVCFYDNSHLNGSEEFTCVYFYLDFANGKKQDHLAKGET